MGPEVTGFLGGFNHRNKETKNVSGISTSSKTF